MNPKLQTVNPEAGRLADRVVLITGGSRGIGLAIAQACAREGAQLALVGRNRTALKNAAQDIPHVAAFAADVTDENDVRRLFQFTRKQFGRVDILVNNAGVFTYKPFTRTTLSDWNHNVSSNLTSLFLVTQALLPLLQRSSKPHIVNILSIAGRVAFPKCSAYCASKFGALGFTRVLAKELRPGGIRVTAILPGSTSTRMADEFDFPVDRKKLLQPEDIAEVTLAAILQPARATVDEIVLTPSQGDVAATRKGKKRK
jgi:NAD(P)-dependent dehydrogenase (short-subunit alcohol dehydrogenase family)